MSGRLLAVLLAVLVCSQRLDARAEQAEAEEPSAGPVAEVEAPLRGAAPDGAAAGEGASEDDGAASEPPPPLPQRPIVVFTLSNGLEVVLEPDRSSPRVAVAVTYAAGLRHQPSGARGIARVVERLMFEGSRNVAPGEHELILERVGATEVGSWTGVDGATFFEEVPAHHLATALWLESDRMSSLLARVDAASVERARRAVTTALVSRREQSAVAALDEVVARTIYRAGHPYRALEDQEREIDAIRLEHVQWFFQRRYAPHRARLAIAGDFDPVAARRLVERYFATIRASSRATVRAAPPERPRLDGEHRINFGALVPARFVRVVWPTPAFLQPGDAELDFVAYVIGQGRRSRLHSRLVEERGVATSVWAWQGSRELASAFTVQMRVADGQGAQAAIDGLDEVLRELCARGPTAEEMTRVRRLNDSRELIESEALVDRATAASRVRSPLAEDRVFRLSQNLARYAAVTPDDVRAAACRELPLDRRVVVVVIPDGDAPRVGRVLSTEVVR